MLRWGKYLFKIAVGIHSTDSNVFPNIALRISLPKNLFRVFPNSVLLISLCKNLC